MAENPFLKLMPLKIPALPASMSVENQGTPDTSQTQLLGESAEQVGLAVGTVNEVAGVHALAELNTDSMKPQDKPITSLTLKAAQRTEKLVLDSAQDVRQLCDQVDQLISSNEQLAGPALIHLRGYVRQLMVTLKEKPEFDNILIDKEGGLSDTRNIMKFIRATREESLLLRDVKTEKKAVRGAKKEKTSTLNAGLSAAFAAVMGKQGLKK